jgi:hypothetical protein
MAGTPEGLAEFGQWSNSTMEYYYSGPPRARGKGLLGILQIPFDRTSRHFHRILCLALPRHPP